MNINYIEQQILKAIDIEKKEIQEEDWSSYTKESFEDRFTDLKKFVKKLFKENREGF